MLAQHHGCSNLLPQAGIRYCKGHCLGHCRMVHEHIVHFLWRNFFPATIDDLLEAARDEQVTFSIQKPLVTCPQPPMCKGMPVSQWIVVVTLHDACAPH